MITMSVSVQMLGDKNEKIGAITQTLPDTTYFRQMNNVSSSLGTIKDKKQGAKPLFFLSDKHAGGTINKASKLDGSATFSPKQVPYYIGGYATGHNDIVTPATEFVVTAQDGGFSGLGIDFDKARGQYPPEIKVATWNAETGDYNAEYTVSDNDAEYHLLFDETSKVKVKIEKWNTKGFPIVITGIYASLALDLDYRSLRNVSHKIIDRSDITMPSYGIMSNSGSFEFKDIDKEVKEYAEERLLRANMLVEFFISNTATQKTQKIGEAVTSKWNYDNNNYVVSVSLKDDIENWQDIQIDMQAYYLDENMQTMLDVYNSLKAITPNDYVFAELSTATKTYLQSISIGENAYIESGSLWSAWDKFGKANGLHIYKNKQGEVVVTR